MRRFIQVVTTTDDKAEAERIARILIDERLAACVQILGPITSTYRWAGRVETAREWLCLIKSRQDLFPFVERVIRANHHYDVPEIIALPIMATGRDYGKWLEHELTARRSRVRGPRTGTRVGRRIVR
jgi:periplasmic divalent cation tolerance protein